MAFPDNTQINVSYYRLCGVWNTHFLPIYCYYLKLFFAACYPYNWILNNNKPTIKGKEINTRTQFESSRLSQAWLFTPILYSLHTAKWNNYTPSTVFRDNPDENNLRKRRAPGLSWIQMRNVFKMIAWDLTFLPMNTWILKFCKVEIIEWWRRYYFTIPFKGRKESNLIFSTNQNETCRVN